MSFTYSYPRPMVTVDAVVFRGGDNGLEVLLIERRNDPFSGSWALPGGFLELDEELEAGALRELKEETGISNISLEQFHTFGDVGRDPRGRSITVAFVGMLNTDKPEPVPVGGDDAADARWFRITDMPVMAFDHGKIIDKALNWLHTEGYL